jgi:hypothetical protein
MKVQLRDLGLIDAQLIHPLELPDYVINGYIGIEPIFFRGLATSSEPGVAVLKAASAMLTLQEDQP